MCAPEWSQVWRDTFPPFPLFVSVPRAAVFSAPVTGTLNTEQSFGDKSGPKPAESQGRALLSSPLALFCPLSSLVPLCSSFPACPCLFPASCLPSEVPSAVFPAPGVWEVADPKPSPAGVGGAAGFHVAGWREVGSMGVQVQHCALASGQGTFWPGRVLQRPGGLQGQRQTKGRC